VKEERGVCHNPSKSFPRGGSEFSGNQLERGRRGELTEGGGFFESFVEGEPTVIWEKKRRERRCPAKEKRKKRTPSIRESSCKTGERGGLG